jgi:hypothetical protein
MTFDADSIVLRSKGIFPHTSTAALTAQFLLVIGSGDDKIVQMIQ